MEPIASDVTVPMVPPEVTAEYRDGGSVPAVVLQRPRVSRLPDEGSGGDLELRELLRQRLWVIALAVTIACSLKLAQILLDYATSPHRSLLQLVGPRFVVLAPVLCMVAAYGVATVILRRKRQGSLRALRCIEGLLFGGGILYIGHNNWSVLVSESLPELLKFTSLLANSQNLLWFLLIVTYGTLIPNTARRCGWVVGCIVLVALTLNASALVAQSIPWAVVGRYMIQMAIWLVYAVTIAVVGSHRLERLRREASAARQVGQYQLKERLGSGGMGEVYLAEHRLLRRPCAVKLIRPERAGDAQALCRFEREVQTTATLSHPNTVQVYDYGHTDDGTFYYVMEYLPGLTLEQLVERHGPLPPARAVHFLRQLCGSLNEAHGVGLIHRDLKPGNVMVCSRGGVYDVAKLLDFGLVLPISDAAGDAKLSRDGAITGTPSYMSPEQASGHEILDQRSDIYSLGAVVYFLLTGRPPFGERSLVKTLAAHMYEQPDPVRRHRPDVPTHLEEVVSRCLRKEPVERFPTIEELEAAVVRGESNGTWSPRDAAEWWRSQAVETG